MGCEKFRKYQSNNPEQPQSAVLGEENAAINLSKEPPMSARSHLYQEKEGAGGKGWTWRD